MKAATAIAAVLSAALILPDLAIAKTHHHAAAKAQGGHSHQGAAKVAHGKAGHGHAQAGHAKAGHAKGGHAKASGRHSRGHARHVAVAPPPPPPPKPQVLTPPSRADRVILPSTVEPSHYDLVFTPNMDANTFSAKARIDLEVKKEVRSITLDAVDMQFQAATLTSDLGLVQTGKTRISAKDQTATFAFDRPVKPGHYNLALDYSGLIYPSAAGLFHLEYDTPTGKAKALYTQFENSDARKLIPSWDEPARKATFSVAVDTPKGLMAVSNMPVVSTEALSDTVNRVRFAQTPKMSTYLLFLAVGDFERVTRQVGDTEVGVVVKRGDSARATYALDAASQLLPYYNSYFGVPFPLPKLDMIAGAGTSQFFGAMENWGAIFYFDREVLVDPKLSTDSDRNRVFIVVAHEMAHQWFGDLVTMEWWDDLWLNEGFATWMETKASSHFHPEWKDSLQALASKNNVMQEDARDGSHPVVQHVRDPGQASEAFDDITYEKGAAVINMFEAYVGPDRFREGVRNYMRAHAYGSAVTDDLWKEMDALGSVKLTPVAHDFTLQTGVPLITVSQQGDNTVLRQSRFGLDASASAPLRWETPVVTARVYGGGAWKGLVSTVEPGAVRGPGDGLVVNTGQSGYFRTLYTGGLFQKLSDAFGRLTPADQIGVVQDASALALSGQEPIGDLLGLMEHVGGDLDPLVTRKLVAEYARLAYLERGLAGESAFKAFARRRLAPLYARIGFDAKPSDTPDILALRKSLVDVLSDIDDPQLLADARARYQSWKSDASVLQPEQRVQMLSVMAVHADGGVWADLLQHAKTAPTAIEKQDFYNLVAAARDPALARQALDLVFQPETPTTTGPAIISQVADDHPELAFNYTVSHWAAVRANLESTSAGIFVPRLVQGASNPDLLVQLDAFAKANIPETSRRTVTAAKAAISYRHKVIVERTPEIDRWLILHAGAKAEAE